MTFHDWLFSIYPPDAVINGRWGTLHICVILLCITIIGLIALLRNKDEAVPRESPSKQRPLVSRPICRRSSPIR